ncbi:3-oxoadipate CoA-transferase, beta subunit [Cupriavidus metallidurans]|jgi:3-oxoadipate CoA-transferase beta subunit|uniref:3-oxoacid CoA-transferase subunit B n=1 Tax=Cupriavidus TaxID=106589 RepID=UPI0004930D07|nr:3-oxoacid CoA-transferase subunit B [Cupriavidus metallidurans]AVA34193.1 3-oxoadipate CoA-transferase [Cupriavidus metallidurans]KWW34954.1 3-oxoadipate CoA-transferase subunit B [Cupriavidus metallidurans]MDE4922162.1 3-oxoacid CoA-transferase subunit B [Cupriavidus metallidurans]UBM08395.1 3-oxoacid CoA-transferase subunit B [Cupriavidus metallidurans]
MHDTLPRLGTLPRLSRAQMARIVAHDIPDGSVVNLGIGMPTLVSDQLPDDREIVLHSENGILGMGPVIREGETDPDLINASKEPISLIAGASISDHAVSFTMMRGGHIDITVLGGFQVAANGDLANWSTGEPDAIPAVGGAMDLVVGAARLFVMMEHVTRDGQPKIVERCSYPLTGIGVVDRIYTDLAVIDVRPGKPLLVTGLVEGVSFETVQALSAAPLTLATDCRVLRPGR